MPGAGGHPGSGFPSLEMTLMLDRHRLAATPVPFAYAATIHASAAPMLASSRPAGSGPEFTHGAGDEFTRTGHAFEAARPGGATAPMAGARYVFRVTLH